VNPWRSECCNNTIGIIADAIVAAMLNMVHFDGNGHAGWAARITPFRFGVSILDRIMTMTLVKIESTGMVLALGEMCGKTLDRRRCRPPGGPCVRAQ
jgi:NCS2 family nucleobase:cation symporter-2